MDLYVNTYGTYIHKCDEMFELEIEGKKTKIAPAKVNSLVVSTSVMITSDVIKLALDHNIDVVFVDEFGDPYGRCWHAKFGSTAFIRRRQLEIFESPEGLHYAVGWITNKIQHEIDHLKALEYKRHAKASFIENEINEIGIFIEQLGGIAGTLEEKRATIMAYEGNAAKRYYGVLSELIPDSYRFNGRSSRPAKDEFNCLLNYAFGVLYGKVEKAVIIAGLDPFVGILHTDNYNKRSFVFDFIENYRHHAVSCVFALFSRKMVNKEYFEKIRGGLTLNKEGKKFLIQHFTETLTRTIRYDGKNIEAGDCILRDCHKLANALIGKEQVC